MWATTLVQQWVGMEVFEKFEWGMIGNCDAIHTLPMLYILSWVNRHTIVWFDIHVVCTIGRKRVYIVKLYEDSIKELKSWFGDTDNMRTTINRTQRHQQDRLD